MTLLQLGAACGAGSAVLVFLGLLWRSFRSLNTVIERTELVPVIHRDVKALSEKVQAVVVEQRRVDGALMAHMADELARDEARVLAGERRDVKIATIEADVHKIAGWSPPAAEAR